MALILPASQFVQMYDREEDANVPALQLVHATALSLENVPTGHARQNDVATLPLKSPAAQLVQEEEARIALL